jgi:hypothetical protein
VSATSAPDAIQPIRAWRVWAGAATGDGLVELRSLTDAAGRTRWPVGEALHARCMRGRHPAPSTECSCGIYAHRSRGAALAHARATPGSIVGEVELWGRVIEHEHGYRSEYARIRALWVPVAPAPCPAEQHNVTETLAQRRCLSGYGVDTGLIHRQSGLSLELADLRAVFVREPPPPTPPAPLRRLLPTLCWKYLRAVVILAATVVVSLTCMSALLLITGIGLVLPFIAGGAVSDLVGRGSIGATLGLATGLGVVGAYYLAAWQVDRFQKNRL